jgi:hypothetical protein
MFKSLVGYLKGNGEAGLPGDRRVGLEIVRKVVTTGDAVSVE